MGSRWELAPPAARTLVDQVVGQLRLAIIMETLPVGEQLTEVRLARELGVGRSTIREALQRLAAGGLLEEVPHRGHRVRAFDDRDTEEICEVFGLLEAHAARRLTAPPPPRVLDRLRELAEQMRALRYPDELDRFLGLDRAFHGELMVLADQRWLHQAWRNQESLLGPLLVTLNRHQPTDGTIQAERHLELVVAAETGDGERLAAACLRHYHLPAGR
ncbi:MAG TPA: GntR family transcriptional regulator [Streptosporangiaceae bacterium]|jgi:DNA-binding GntR family transcriptional regulator